MPESHVSQVFQHTVTALYDVGKERMRQVLDEHYDPQHDDRWAGGELSDAAAAYASRQDLPWPWPKEWDKRTKHSRRRRLVIAAALLVAEVERLDRAAERR